MRLATLTFGVALTGFLVLTEAEVVAAVAGLVAVAMLLVLGYREGSWRALRFAAIVPAAALAADVLTFAGLSPQTGSEVNLYTYAAFVYSPAWVLLVLLGLTARRVTAGHRGLAR